MKYILLILFAIVSITSHAQISKLNTLFEKYEEAKGVTSIKIAKPMFKLLENLKIEDEDLKKVKSLTNTINSIKILIIEDSASYVPSEFLAAIKNLRYEELFTLSRSGSKIKFLADNTTGKTISNLVLSITDEKQNIFMHLDGKLNMDDISNLANNK